MLLTILQSWSQGAEVWGESDTKTLWSATKVKFYGGGVSEVNFLQDLSKLVGQHDRYRSSTSAGRGQYSLQRQVQRETTLDVDDLGAMPKGRALVIASGARPTLIRTQPWMRGPHAEAVKETIARFDPQARQTLVAAESELVRTEADLVKEDVV